MIVGAYERSDRPASEIAQILENGGLSKVTMPLVISPALAPHVTTHEPLVTVSGLGVSSVARWCIGSRARLRPGVHNASMEKMFWNRWHCRQSS